MPEPGPSRSLEEMLGAARWVGGHIQHSPDEGKLAAIIAWVCDDLDEMTALTDKIRGNLDTWTELLGGRNDKQGTSKQD